MAAVFAESAGLAGVRQIVYLGGIANDERSSTHLASRMKTGEVLASSGVPVIELRSGVIIGSGSAMKPASAGAAHGSESSGRRKPIGESPGIR